MQAPRDVVMIRPHRFNPNPATVIDNTFQSVTWSIEKDEIARRAHAEVSGVADCLRSEGVRVHLFEDVTGDHPDSVFPNNWFSTHSGGQIAVYPMFSPSRRGERRSDVIEMLKSQFRVQEVVDYSGLEQDGIFLEGTGGMVLDNVERVAYAARSNRLSEIALERFCAHFNFEPMVFDAVDRLERPVYHTNVMMSVGTDLALIASGMIRDQHRLAEIIDRLRSSGRRVIELEEEQISAFAGNCIELQGARGTFLLMSDRAVAALSRRQRHSIEGLLPIVAVGVSTIELAGGSVRCMIAGIHLTPRSGFGAVPAPAGLPMSP